MRLSDLPTPALVVDVDRLEHNLATMATRAEGLGVGLRPHVKTHKCVEIGRMQLAAGAVGITVSTIEEARAFAEAGCEDITWAFPLIPGRVDELKPIAEAARLGVLVDSSHSVQHLAASELDCRVWIKVDCGYHRAGVLPEVSVVAALAGEIESSGLEFAGLLSHSGDAYDAESSEERGRIAAAEATTLNELAQGLRAAGQDVPGLSCGSTPAATAAESLPGVTEMRPGNYAFFDRQQLVLGACATKDLALSVVSTVVSSGVSRSICDAGALALSKDESPYDGSMGAIWRDHEHAELEPELRLIELSQEHGKLSAPLPVGSRVRILPNHCCLAAACFSRIHAVRGNRVENTWQVWNSR